MALYLVINTIDIYMVLGVYEFATFAVFSKLFVPFLNVLKSGGLEVNFALTKRSLRLGGCLYAVRNLKSLKVSLSS